MAELELEELMHASIPIISGAELKLPPEEIEKRCDNLTALCELTGIHVTGIGVELNYVPIAEVETGEGKKGHIRYYGEGVGLSKNAQLGHAEMEADFDITKLGVPAEKDVRGPGDEYWKIDVSKL